MLKDLKSESGFEFRVPVFLASSEQIAEALGRIRTPHATFSVSLSACPDVSIPANFVYQDGRKCQPQESKELFSSWESSGPSGLFYTGNSVYKRESLKMQV